MGDQPPKQIREQLLQQAARLAVEQGSALRLEGAVVAAAAGLGEGDFSLCFADHRAFLLALMVHFLDRARAEAIEALEGAAPGIPRIVTAFVRFWDANCRWRPMRELALHLCCDPEGAEVLRLRSLGAAKITQFELAAIGWKHPAASAWLVTQMCVETAVAEFEAGRELPEMREAVLAYFREPWPRAEAGGAAR